MDEFTLRKAEQFAQNHPDYKVKTSLLGDVTMDELTDIIFASVMREGANPDSTWMEIYREFGVEHEIAPKVAEIDNDPFFKMMGLTSDKFK